MNQYLNLRPRMDWASASRLFPTTKALFDSQPNYENEVALAQDTKTKYQGVAAVVGGWVYADGRPGPYPFPPDPAPVNDNFTVVFLDFEGLEGSTTYPDTNGAGQPRKWTQRCGNGSITNVDELFDDGSLLLDGATVITAPDESRFDRSFRDQDFTIRGYFSVDFSVPESRVLAAKTDEQTLLGYEYFIDLSGSGLLRAGFGIDVNFEHRIVDRFTNEVVDRVGGFVLARPLFVAGGESVILQSTSAFSATFNTGWHSFAAKRHGSIMTLEIDGVVEDTKSIGAERILQVPGPFTIGGYGPPKNGAFQGLPWKGGLDRFAIDLGIAR